MRRSACSSRQFDGTRDNEPRDIHRIWDGRAGEFGSGLLLEILSSPNSMGEQSSRTTGDQEERRVGEWKREQRVLDADGFEE